jgi:uncharacterized protein GlcG (DUF336 family)
MKKTLAPVIALGMSLGLAAPAALADDAMIVPVQRLTMETAVKVAQATIAACREKGIQIAATVVDRDGTVQVVLRDTIAAPLTLNISAQKAYTASNFNAATSAMEDRGDTPVGRVDGLVMSAGGVPIEVGGSLLGAVGVSGAPAGETDEECARAGVAAVQTDLEMAM